MYNVKLTVVITLHSGNGAGYIRLHPVVEITTIVVSPRLLHPPSKICKSFVHNPDDASKAMVNF